MTMRAGMLALAMGLISLRFLPSIPSWPVLLALAAVAGACLLSRWRLLGWGLLGFCWACYQAQAGLDQRLPVGLDGQTFWLEGRVSGLPDVRGNVIRFELTEVRSRHAGLPQRLRLAWYDGPRLREGEHWRLAARLKRPHGLVNPSGFDYEAWLLARGVGATGTVKTGQRVEAAAGPAGWRDRLRERLMAVNAQGRQGGLAALVLGDDSGLSAQDWRVLQATGTVHLMVISGQHVGMLAGLLYGFVALLVRAGLWPHTRGEWVPWACGLAMLGAFSYGWLAGFAVPVQRACLMVAVVLLWRLRFRHLGVWLPLLIALDAVLLIDPLASLQPGFWLSFGAVGLLALVFSGRLGAWSWWHSLGRAQWAMALGLLPLMVGLGLPVSLSGPLANLAAVPVVSLLVVPLALLGTAMLWLPFFGEGLLWLAGGVLAGLFHGLEWLAVQQAAWQPPSPSLLAGGLLGLGVGLLLLPQGVPVRALGAVLALPFLCSSPDRPPLGQAVVQVLDVGQGLAVVIRTHSHQLLYDAGPRHGDFDLGERVVVPVLRGLGIGSLDLMLLSHADSDHAGGAEAVLASVPAQSVISGESGQLAPRLSAAPCDRGADWEWDGVRFSLWQAAQPASGNAASCVLRVEASGERLLLTGDIDSATEAELIRSHWPLRAEWLLLAHHGSRSSSSTSWLASVQPRAALVSRGLHNGFGHPHPAVLERLRAGRIPLFDTAVDGALTLQLGRRKPIARERDERRFWREK